MITHRVAFAVLAAALLAGPGSARARAQVMSWGDPSVSWSGPAVAASAFGSGAFGSVALPEPTPSFPYSYYAAFPNPARQYVPYGPMDAFPFHGNAYGKPYDRWTWTYLAGPPGSLQRYYYPPVR